MTHQFVSQIDWRALVDATCVQSVEYLDEIESTNSHSQNIGRLEELKTPCLVIADRQTSGRGRGKNAWFSSPGGLTFSLIVETSFWNIPTAVIPIVSLATGNAVALAVDSELPNAAPQCRLKWPNDIYLIEKKLGGILIESIPGMPHRLVIGVGLNVNNSLAGAPQELRATAISLCDVQEQPANLLTLMTTLVAELDHQLQQLAVQPTKVLNQWANRCLLNGRLVRIESAGDIITGMCAGIDETGALIVQTELGRRRIVAGSVLSFE